MSSQDDGCGGQIALSAAGPRKVPRSPSWRQAGLCVCREGQMKGQEWESFYFSPLKEEKRGNFIRKQCVN